MQRGTLGDINVLYFDCSGGYIAVCIHLKDLIELEMAVLHFM